MAEFYYSFKRSYFSFKDSLKENIQNNKIYLKNKECYLITDIWIKDLINNFYQIDSIIQENPNKNYSEEFYNFNPNKEPIFINDISTAIKYLEKNYRIELINRELMDKIFAKEYLIKNVTVNYFSGNNLLIIEFIRVV